MRRLAKKNDEKDGSALHEASVLSSYADGAGRTAIHFAANFGVLPCCEYIVETAPEYVLFVSLSKGCRVGTNRRGWRLWWCAAP